MADSELKFEEPSAWYRAMVADLCDADRRHPIDVAERAEWEITAFPDGVPFLARVGITPEYDPFERDQTYKED